MTRSSDGKTRDLVTSMQGAGWDFGLDRHPYFEIERPLGPHYCVYNRRLMACALDALPTDDGYWSSAGRMPGSCWITSSSTMSQR